MGHRAGGPGNYYELVHVRSGVILESEAGPAVTTIHARVNLHHGATVRGFTVHGPQPEYNAAAAITLYDVVGARAENCILIVPVPDPNDHYRSGIFLSLAEQSWFEDCHVAGNAMAYEGGGFRVDLAATFVVRNCTFTDNYAAVRGGGIGIYEAGRALIENCTLVGNATQHRGGGYYGWASLAMKMRNNIIVESVAPDTGGVWDYSYASTQIIFNDVWGNLGGNYYDLALVGPGNISEDPLFVEGIPERFYLTQAAAGQPGQSPCVDAGDPMVLPWGTTRTDGVPDWKRVDMGYHYAHGAGTPTATPTSTGTPTPLPPTATPTPTVSPSPTVSPTPEWPGGAWVELSLNRSWYAPGDRFELLLRLGNRGGPGVADLYVVLDPGGGRYWFWPSWVAYPPSVDREQWRLWAGMEYAETVLELVWPEGAGSASGLRFWAALVDPADGELWDLTSCTFGYGEAEPSRAGPGSLRRANQEPGGERRRPPVLPAEAALWSRELVSLSDNPLKSDPRLALGEDGRLCLAWVEGPLAEPNRWEVWYRERRAGGWSPAARAVLPEGHQPRPALAAGPGGAAGLVYVEEQPDRHRTGFRSRLMGLDRAALRRCTAPRSGAEVLQLEAVPLSAGNGRDFDPCLIRLSQPEGGAPQLALAWVRLPQPGSDLRGLYWAETSGRALVRPQAVAVPPPRQGIIDRGPSVAVDRLSGAIHIVTWNFLGAGDPWRLRHHQRDAEADTWRTEPIPRTAGARNPSLLWSGEPGVFHLVYLVDQGMGRAEYRYLRHAHGAWGRPMSVGPAHPTLARAAGAAGDDGGNLWIAWLDPQGQIRLRRRSAAGVWSQPLTVTRVGNHRGASLAVDPRQDRIFLAYAEETPSGPAVDRIFLATAGIEEVTAVLCGLSRRTAPALPSLHPGR